MTNRITHTLAVRGVGGKFSAAFATFPFSVWQHSTKVVEWMGLRMRMRWFVGNLSGLPAEG